MLVALIVAVIVGWLTGALARLALPGKDPLGFFATTLVGIGGTVIATLIVYVATDGQQVAGWLLGFTVSVAIVYVIRRRRGGGLVDPGTPGRQ